MNRRQLLLGLAGVGAAGRAVGYAALDGRSGFVPTDDTPTGTPTETPVVRPDPADYGQVADEGLPVPIEDILNGLPKDAIRSIAKPALGPSLGRRHYHLLPRQ